MTLTCVLNLGLKSMRAAAFDDRGRRIGIVYRPIATRLGEGMVEQDPEAGSGISTHRLILSYFRLLPLVNGLPIGDLANVADVPEILFLER